jgi:hypothetical protein
MNLQKDFFSMSSNIPPVNDNPVDDGPDKSPIGSYSVGHYPKMICPHCHGPSTGFKTTQLTELIREISYLCQNGDCRHMFVAQIEPVRSIIGSRNPNPNIKLPVRPE